MYICCTCAWIGNRSGMVRCFVFPFTNVVSIDSYYARCMSLNEGFPRIESVDGFIIDTETSSVLRFEDLVWSDVRFCRHPGFPFTRSWLCAAWVPRGFACGCEPNDMCVPVSKNLFLKVTVLLWFKCVCVCTCVIVCEVSYIGLGRWHANASRKHIHSALTKTNPTFLLALWQNADRSPDIETWSRSSHLLHIWGFL